MYVCIVATQNTLTVAKVKSLKDANYWAEMYLKINPRPPLAVLSEDGDFIQTNQTQDLLAYLVGSHIPEVKRIIDILHP